MVKLLRACVWMPRRKEAKKDVVSYDKLREAANRLWSGDFRMGKPNACEHALSFTEFIGGEKQTPGSEPSQYREEEKTTVIPRVVASESGRA
jgi:hypothetical protein